MALTSKAKAAAGLLAPSEVPILHHHVAERGASRATRARIERQQLRTRLQAAGGDVISMRPVCFISQTGVA
jgi:hypothetical protein